MKIFNRKPNMSNEDCKPEQTPQEATAEEQAPKATKQAEETHDEKKDQPQQEETSPEPTPEERIQEMGEKMAAMNDKYIRLYSEYENYRNRTNQEKADLLLNGGKEAIKAMLPVADDMERALANIPDDNAAKEGVTLVFNKLMSALAQKGVKPMEAKGQPFDENLHEAVSQIPASDEKQKGMVVDVKQTGYTMNGKVLRFPKVVVAI